MGKIKYVYTELDWTTKFTVWRSSKMGILQNLYDGEIL